MRKCLLAATALAISGLAAANAPVMAQDAAPAAGSSKLMPLGRLPDTVKPAAYRLDLTVDPNAPRFSGHVEIDATLKAPGTTVFLHGRELNVSRATATAGGKTIAGRWQQLEETGVAVLTFDAPLPAGAVTFAFDYDAPFADGPAGMFRIKIDDTWYSWTQHESIDARASFPGFDEPGFKTPFTITLRTPKGLTAVSNAPEVAKTEEGGLEVHRFAPTLPLPTYLVAMMVGPFATVESTVPPTPQRSQPLPLRVVSPKPNAGKLGYALDNSKTIVGLLENYFGQPFPYPKLDQITTPVMPGAMENAGADLYGDSILVLDEKAPVAARRTFGMVVAHELAHQWFGDLVTPVWWDDIWLNESFANWMGYHIGEQWRGDLHIGSGANAEGFSAMNTDALIAGRPIHQRIERNSQVDAAFDTITYGKGGHVVAMIAAFMGDEKFRDGVRGYMAAHKYGNATSADFFAAMASASGDPRILPAMQSFTDQQGVPLVTFTRSGKGWKAVQSRYARLGTTAPETTWGIPLCIRRGDGRTCRLMDGKEMEVAVPGKGPIMPNAGGTGYYRFELSPADWDALIATADKLSGNEALALSDSLKASYLAGRASVSQMASLARKLVRNPDSHASETALAGMEAARASGLFDSSAQRSYRAFVGDLYRPLLGQLGTNFASGAYAEEDPEQVQRRIAMVDALDGIARNKQVRKGLAQAADAYLSGNPAALDPMWFGSAFSDWLDLKGLPGARSLFERAMASQDPSLRPVLLGVIGGSGDKAIAAWILNEARDDRLRLSERQSLIRAVIANSVTRDLGYEWMKSHLDELFGGSSGIFFAAKLPAALAGACSIERASAIEGDLGKRLSGTASELEFARTIERIRDCGLLQYARRAQASAEMRAIR